MRNENNLEQKYLETSCIEHSRKRIFWLLFLTFSSLITGAIISYYENAFLVLPALVSFMPLLMGMGGNCGSQSATLIIRGLATGEITEKDYLKIISKESLVAIICGLILSVVNFFMSWLRCGDAVLALVVGVTTIIVVIISKLVGGILPLVAKRIHLDPALLSSPIISTLLDAISIISYFLIAKLFLNI